MRPTTGAQKPSGSFGAPWLLDTSWSIKSAPYTIPDESLHGIRLLAWCIFFHEKLRSTFDVEMDSPQGQFPKP